MVQHEVNQTSTHNHGLIIGSSTGPINYEQVTKPSLIETLEFAGIYNRSNQLRQALVHGTSMKWIFEEGLHENEPVRFTEWLRGDHGQIFWITGKPGSGKSSSIHLISKSELTLANLRKGSSKKVVVLSHYFWIVGAPLQRSLEGFLRSLLVQICDENDVSLGPIMRDLQAERVGSFANGCSWPVERLQHSLLEAFKCKNPWTQFLLLIDGLDEFEDDSRDVHHFMQFVYRISRQLNVKICVASREWPVIGDNLKGRVFQKLEVHKHTLADIELYIQDQLACHPSICRILAQDPERCHCLLRRHRSPQERTVSSTPRVPNNDDPSELAGDTIAMAQDIRLADGHGNPADGFWELYNGTGSERLLSSTVSKEGELTLIASSNSESSSPRSTAGHEPRISLSFHPEPRVHVNDALVCAISRKASGVFYWVSLVVKKIRKVSSHLKSRRQMMQMINDFPDDLYEYFKRMVDNIPKPIRRTSARLLLMKFFKPSHVQYKGDASWSMPYVLACAIDEEDDASTIVRGALACDLDTDLRALEEETNELLTQACPDLISFIDSDSGLPLSGYKFTFSHKAVSDFLHRIDIQRKLQDMAGAGFHPVISLIRGFISTFNLLYRLYLGLEKTDKPSPDSLQMYLETLLGINTKFSIILGDIENMDTSLRATNDDLRRQADENHLRFSKECTEHVLLSAIANRFSAYIFNPVNSQRLRELDFSDCKIIRHVARAVLVDRSVFTKDGEKVEKLWPRLVAGVLKDVMTNASYHAVLWQSFLDEGHVTVLPTLHSVSYRDPWDLLRAARVLHGAVLLISSGLSIKTHIKAHSNSLSWRRDEFSNCQTYFDILGKVLTQDEMKLLREAARAYSQRKQEKRLFELQSRYI